MNTQKQILLIVILFFLFVGTCTAYAFVDQPRAERMEDFYFGKSAERGALLFANNCRTCHGLRGEGGVGLTLDKPEFKDQNPQKLKENRDFLRRTIECGRAGTRMPAWLKENGGSLTPYQIEHVIDLITGPATEDDPQNEGEKTSEGWLHAVEFGENLNHEGSAVVSGDTLDTIAKAHGIGPRETAQINGLQPDSPIRNGDTVKLPDGRSVRVFGQDETVTRVAEKHHVGAVILARLNNLAFKVDTERATFTLRDGNKDLPGLTPGQKLALPEGAVYVVRAADTPTSIAQAHGLRVTELRAANSQNRDLAAKADDAQLAFERTLDLPPGTLVVVQPTDTLGSIATTHNLKVEELALQNGLEVTEQPAVGSKLKLPGTLVYVIQVGDTLGTVAREHDLDPAALARLNNLTAEANTRLDPRVILSLPRVQEYVVVGQTLAEVAAGFSNVTDKTLGAANQVAPDAVLRIGTTLTLPDDAWGSAPPDAVYRGTACIQHALQQAIYETLPGVGTPRPDPPSPTELTREVRIEANDNDWTVFADGRQLTANDGAVLVNEGTTIQFKNNRGLHTITINGAKQGPDFTAGEERQRAFSPTASKFRIACDYHAAMRAFVFTPGYVETTATAAATGPAGTTTPATTPTPR